MNPRYLTKSRFKIGLECPTKLFYTKKEEYFDSKLEDDFLQSLAEGGFQVGELAKLYYPGGVNIDELDYTIALERTKVLMAQPEAIIYEAAFLYENLFIRADLLIKKGNEIRLIEVKAKSYDPDKDEDFLNTHGFIKPKWGPYLYDAAFQKFVVEHAYPSFNVSAYLLLADKSKVASVDGLNQKFIVFTTDSRKQVKVNGPVEPAALGEKILVLKNIDAIVAQIYAGTESKEKDPLTFRERIYLYSEKYQADEKIDSPIGGKCGGCEFTLDPERSREGLKSGFHECWREKAAFTDADFLRPSILHIWNFRRKEEYIRRGIYFQDLMSPTDFEPARPSDKTEPGLSHWERQALQVEMAGRLAVEGKPLHYLDIDGLKDTMSEWKYPYHFIDFETTSVAIPFTRGRRPYESIAFQFSHHVLYEDGKIEHKGQWICAEPGVFPNFAFVRALKKELSEDDGTIFRYADHENTILNAIYKQLGASEEEDKEALRDWIRQVSHSGNNSVERWKGDRDMVDLKEVVRKFYYNPLTGGSISIKAVMPAILNSCDYLKDKYAKPIYGTESIRSLNFTKQQWVQYAAGQNLINPYDLLPPIHDGIDNDLLDGCFTDEDAGIQEGGAAMSAYAKMQFTEMGAAERERIISALLKYCELDTFAMILVWEGLAHWMGRGIGD